MTPATGGNEESLPLCTGLLHVIGIQVAVLMGMFGLTCGIQVHGNVCGARRVAKENDPTRAAASILGRRNIVANPLPRPLHAFRPSWIHKIRG